MTPTITRFPRADRRDQFTQILAQLAHLRIRPADPEADLLPHDPSILDSLGVTAGEYTAAAHDLADAFGTTPVVASRTLDAIAIAVSQVAR